MRLVVEVSVLLDTTPLVELGWSVAVLLDAPVSLAVGSAVEVTGTSETRAPESLRAAHSSRVLPSPQQTVFLSASWAQK